MALELTTYYVIRALLLAPTVVLYLFVERSTSLHWVIPFMGTIHLCM